LKATTRQRLKHGNGCHNSRKLFEIVKDFPSDEIVLQEKKITGSKSEIIT